jgi:hypothetical protein
MTVTSLMPALENGPAGPTLVASRWTRTAPGRAGQARAGVECGTDRRLAAADPPGPVVVALCHETIYQAIYHGGKGGLSMQLTKRLRTGRPLRQRRRRANERTPRFVAPAVLIGRRLAIVEARARLVTGRATSSLGGSTSQPSAPSSTGPAATSSSSTCLTGAAPQRCAMPSPSRCSSSRQSCEEPSPGTRDQRWLITTRSPTSSATASSSPTRVGPDNDR